jgi:hypothetical protein
MADSKTRKQRLRQRRQQAGLKAVLVWLSPEAQAARSALGQGVHSPWSLMARRRQTRE